MASPFTPPSVSFEAGDEGIAAAIRAAVAAEGVLVLSDLPVAFPLNSVRLLMAGAAVLATDGAAAAPDNDDAATTAATTAATDVVTTTAVPAPDCIAGTSGEERTQHAPSIEGRAAATEAGAERTGEHPLWFRLMATEAKNMLTLCKLPLHKLEPLPLGRAAALGEAWRESMSFIETMEARAVPTLVRALALAGSVPTLGGMDDIMCVHRLVDYYASGHGEREGNTGERKKEAKKGVGVNDEMKTEVEEGVAASEEAGVESRVESKAGTGESGDRDGKRGNEGDTTDATTNGNDNEARASKPRCGAHRDYGLMTLVFQDFVGGLEVAQYYGSSSSSGSSNSRNSSSNNSSSSMHDSAEGGKVDPTPPTTWLSIDPPTDATTCVLMFGRCAQISSNNRIKAALHRVASSGAPAGEGAEGGVEGGAEGGLGKGGKTSTVDAASETKYAPQRTSFVFCVWPKPDVMLGPTIIPGEDAAQTPFKRMRTKDHVMGMSSRKWGQRPVAAAAAAAAATAATPAVAATLSIVGVDGELPVGAGAGIGGSDGEVVANGGAEGAAGGAMRGETGEIGEGGMTGLDTG
jgi:hypothetical protein